MLMDKKQQQHRISETKIFCNIKIFSITFYLINAPLLSKSMIFLKTILTDLKL